MRAHPFLTDPAARFVATEVLRSRIAILLREPAVAQRVGRRLVRAAEASADHMAGTPPCLRAERATLPAPVLVKSGRCRDICRSVDCLCGRYPRSLSTREIDDGRRLETLAV